MLAATGIRMIMAVRKRALWSERLFSMGSRLAPGNLIPKAKHLESRTCLARERNKTHAKAKTVPGFLENASTARNWSLVVQIWDRIEVRIFSRRYCSPRKLWVRCGMSRICVMHVFKGTLTSRQRPVPNLLGVPEATFRDWPRREIHAKSRR